MALSGKDLLAAFKAAPWKGPKDIEAFVQSAVPVAAADFLKLVDFATGKAAEPSLVALRCSALGALASGLDDRAAFLPLVKAARAAEGPLRETLLSILPRVNNIEAHPEVCALLRSSDATTRQVGAKVLARIGGKTTLTLLAEMVAEREFAGRIEAMGVVVQVAGHHAIPTLQTVLALGKPPEKLQALKWLSSPNFISKDVPRALAAIAAGLRDPSPQVLCAAITAYCAVCSEDDYFDTIIEFVDAPKLEVVKAAVEGLRRFPCTRTMDVLVRKIRAGPNTLRFSVLSVLEAIGNDLVLAALVEALGSKQVVVRTRAGEVLKRLGQEQKIELGRTVIWLLRSREADVRRMAVDLIRGLPKEQTSELWPKLIGFMRDEDWWVRERVMDALVEMAGNQLTRHLVPYLGDPSDVVRRFAVEVIGRLRDPQALGALVRAASSDTDWWVRERAIEAVAELKDPRGVPYVVDINAKAPELAVACLQALKVMEAKSAAPQVVAQLGSTDPDVRLAALSFLSVCGDPAQAAAIQPLTRDGEPAVRAAAIDLLTRWKVASSETFAEDKAHSTLDRLLSGVSRADGDDLILAPNRQPMVKRFGKVQPLIRGVLTAEQVEALLLPRLTASQLRALEQLDEVDLSYEMRGEGLRFRVNVFKQMTGLSAVFRRIRGNLIELEALGLPPVVQKLGELKNGLVLVGGPTGSGKSTTLTAIIDHINRTTGRHIISFEDPIEVLHRRKKSLVNQRELGTHTQSFHHSLRAALREDPDVILVGEMRDLETISFAVTAAETGHLVFGTIHTVSADSSVDRLISAFPPNQQEQVRSTLAQSLQAVVCQYLLRRIDDPEKRCVALEVLLNTDAVANLIRKGKTFQIPSIIATSRELGMQLMDTDLMRLVKQGWISGEEAYLKARNKKDFEAAAGIQSDPARTDGAAGPIPPTPTPPSPGSRAA